MTERLQPKPGESLPEAPRRWSDLTPEQQERVRALLTADEDDNLDDLAYRCERTLQVIRGEYP